jgi:hypothetical protein
LVTFVSSEHKSSHKGAANAPDEQGNWDLTPNEQGMLRIDIGAQIIDDHYYQVLGDKSEGGTGDTQINHFESQDVAVPFAREAILLNASRIDGRYPTRPKGKKPSVIKEMKGVCLFFTETGTEGGWWAMHEDGFVRSDGHWMYQGLRFLEEGDDFTVYADDGSVLFHAIIHKDSRTGAIPRQVIRNGKLVKDPTWKQQCVSGL